MVAMASDSYLLKMPPPPCQAGCRGAAVVRSTSCGVVVALVLMLAAVLALGGMLYYQRLELCSVRADVAALDLRLKDVDHKLNRLHEYESIKAFEATPVQEDDDEDDEDLQSEEDDGDDPDPYYSDIEEDGLMFERRGQSHGQGSTWPSRHVSVVSSVAGTPVAAPGTASPPSAAATALTMLEEGDSDSDFSDSDSASLMDSDAAEEGERAASTASPTTAQAQQQSEQSPAVRVRREVGPSGPTVRADPQLRLYHMLQSPGPAAVAAVAAAPSNPPEDAWSRGRPQPMYAERAPMEFVDPPGRHRAPRPLQRYPEPVGVARRRSRVMDTTPNVGDTPAPHRQWANQRQMQWQTQQQRHRRQRARHGQQQIEAQEQVAHSRGQRVNDSY